MQAIYHNRALLTYIIETKQAEMDKIGVKMTAFETQMNALMNKYRKTELTPPEADLLGKFDKAWSPYAESAKKVMAFSYADKNAEAMQEFHTVAVPAFQVADDLLSAIYDLNIELGKKNDEEGQVATNKARMFSIGIVVMGVAVLLVVSLTIASSITGVLGGEPKDLALQVEAITEGNLAQTIVVKQGDAESLQARLASMQSNLRRLVDAVRQSAQGVSNASREIAQGNSDLSGRTEEQASALEETAASMEQLGASSKHNTDNANQASQMASSASAVAAEGGNVVAQVVDTMKGINESSRKIADIISVIEGIAFQTNILALNAAVEAARAGDQGRGFAVVASEVRALAGRSAEAAKEIKSLINASVERVEQGTSLVDRAGETMTRVVESIQRVTQVMGEIRAASSEQSAGVTQVGEAVTQMDQATQQNSALVEEMAAAATSLESQAGDLVEIVAVFKLDAGDVGHRTSPQSANSPTRKPMLKSNAKFQTPSRDALVTALSPLALPKI
jgi:methyl-accepting chemotaxis protein